MLRQEPNEVGTRPNYGALHSCHVILARLRTYRKAQTETIDTVIVCTFLRQRIPLHNVIGLPKGNA